MNKLHKSGSQRHKATTAACIKVGSENKKNVFLSVIYVLFYLSNFVGYWAYVPQK